MLQYCLVNLINIKKWLLSKTISNFLNNNNCICIFLVLYVIYSISISTYVFYNQNVNSSLLRELKMLPYQLIFFYMKMI